MFIRLTAKGIPIPKGDVIVLVKIVEAILPDSSGSTVLLQGGHNVRVQESPDKIVGYMLKSYGLASR